MTDYALLQGFDYKVFNALRNLKNEKTGKKIWNEMNFKKEIIPITCQENFSLKPPFDIIYELSESSKADLKDLAVKLVEQTKPYVVIFASCFSYQSEIRDFLVENGILATLDITNDRGKISDGRLFALDKVQRKIHNKLREVIFTFFGCLCNLTIDMLLNVFSGSNQKLVPYWLFWNWQNSSLGQRFKI